ncbi:hypothetical protein QQZ08_003931 [Neonectria magnoliae]|uniref:DNA2/NAM7 helicase helicase domain-containing protein n=1 Tax=Neonectria magnoliae TaxID=2732573 RepID=A0ABR1I7K0_9HYPO
MAQHLHCTGLMQHDAIQPSKIQSSMSNFAKQLADDDKENWADFHRGLAELASEPDDYAANLADRREAARTLLISAVKSCDAICTTPVAFVQMANHVTDLDIELMVVDEASRFTEASSLISVSKCPYASPLFLSDNRHFAPFSIARSDRDNRDFFGRQ